jgi:hypothetical protein
LEKEKPVEFKKKKRKTFIFLAMSIKLFSRSILVFDVISLA